jgi:hypothetical protein
MFESREEKINADYVQGEQSESDLMNLMIGQGYLCYKANKNQNKFEHWDFAIKENGVFTRIDAKGDKKAHPLGFTWIEYKNILGYDGWIKCEIMDVLAFEREDRFDFVNRAELFSFVDEKVKKADLEDENRKELIDENGDIVYCSVDVGFYRKYRRMGRSDQIVKAPFSDFEHLIYKTIYKK